MCKMAVIQLCGSGDETNHENKIDWNQKWERTVFSCQIRWL